MSPKQGWGPPVYMYVSAFKTRKKWPKKGKKCQRQKDYCGALKKLYSWAPIYVPEPR